MGVPAPVTMRSSLAVLIALLSLSPGCQRPEQTPPSDSVAPSASVTPTALPITDRDWALSMLGVQTNPMGNGDRAPTLRLESATGRASGFAGCNRFSGSYTLSGDSLSFGPLISTKMACAQGNDVEVSYLAALGNVRTFTVADSVLTLRGADAPVAIFRAQ